MGLFYQSTWNNLYVREFMTFPLRFFYFKPFSEERIINVTSTLRLVECVVDMKILCDAKF